MYKLPKSSLRNRGSVVCSIPGAGRQVLRPCLYAATFVDLPGVVKVGRSWQGWSRRRYAYRKTHGGLLVSAIYSLYDESPALDNLEMELVRHMPLPVHSGLEWFAGTLEDATRAIEGVLDTYGMDYGAEWEHAV